MFGWFKKKTTYSREAVTYIIREILRQTIDKQSIHLTPEILLLDESDDEKKLVQWMNRLDQLKNKM